MCDIDSDDSNLRTWDQEVRTARKVHVCSTCHLRVQPGQSYMRWFAIDGDGDCIIEKSCADCWFVQEAFGQEHHFWPAPTYLLEMLRECVVEDFDGGRPEWRSGLAGILKRRRAVQHAERAA